jgi:hypothetical protein
MSKSTKAAKTPRSPKQGSAQANQSVKGVKSTAKPNADQIITVTPARTGNGLVVVGGDSKSMVVAAWQDTATTRKLAVVGGSMATLRDHVATIAKPQARLARGVDSHNAPHSAKAMADQRAKANSAPTTPKPKARADKASKNKQPSRGQDRKYKNAGRKDESKDGTFRKYMLSTIMAHKSTADAKAAHAKSKKFPSHKLDFNWAAQQGYIAFTDK